MKAEVERWLSACIVAGHDMPYGDNSHVSFEVEAPTLEALCRAWLALDKSVPVGVEDWEAALTEYVEDYQFHGEDESGRDGCYTPNERERLLIEDAIRGWEPPKAHAQQPEARGVVDEGSRSVTRQLLHWGGFPVHVTGTVTTSPGNWSLIDAALAVQPGGSDNDR